MKNSKTCTFLNTFIVISYFEKWENCKVSKGIISGLNMIIELRSNLVLIISGIYHLKILDLILVCWYSFSGILDNNVILYLLIYLWVFKSSSTMIFSAKICGHLMCTFCIEEDECLKCHPKIDSNFSIFCEPWVYSSVLLSIDSSGIFRFRWDFRRILVDYSVSDLILVIWTYFGQFWRFRSFRNLVSFWSILTFFLNFRPYSRL